MFTDPRMGCIGLQRWSEILPGSGCIAPVFLALCARLRSARRGAAPKPPASAAETPTAIPMQGRRRRILRRIRVRRWPHPRHPRPRSVRRATRPSKASHCRSSSRPMRSPTARNPMAPATPPRSTISLDTVRLLATSHRLPATSHRLPGMSRLLPATSRCLLGMSKLLPAMSRRLPAMSNLPPATSRRLPAMSNLLPTSSRRGSPMIRPRHGPRLIIHRQPEAVPSSRMPRRRERPRPPTPGLPRLRHRLRPYPPRPQFQSSLPARPRHCCRRRRSTRWRPAIRWGG